MNRDALRPALLALVCAVAIVLSAATLTSTVQTGGSGFGAGEGGGIGADENDGLDNSDENGEGGLLPERPRESGGSLLTPPCLHWLTEPWALVLIVSGFVGLGAVVYRRLDAFAAVGLMGTMAIPTVLLYLLFTACVSGESDGGLLEPITGNSSGGGGPVGISNPSIPNTPVDAPIAIVVLVAAALVGVLAVVLSDRESVAEALGPVWLGGQDEEPAGDPGDPAGRRLAVGKAAGRAADRIEDDADVENEVYRAWVEMTRYLEVAHPESSTPAEFASAAVEAGFDREDVDELTGLFEVVRYGGRTATDEREQRAVEALRRIELASGGDAE